jgi:hypothetical protein
MEVLLEDIKRTLGAKHIYLPGSVEQSRHLARRNGKAVHAKEDSMIEELELPVVEGLGIVDSAVDMSHVNGSRRIVLDARSAAESEKDNLAGMRSRVIKVKEGRKGRLEMVG